MILNFYISLSAHFVSLRDIQIWLAFMKEIETFYSWSNTVVYQSALISLSTHIFPLDCAFHLSRSLLFELLVEVCTVSVWYNAAWICCLLSSLYKYKEIKSQDCKKCAKRLTVTGFFNYYYFLHMENLVSFLHLTSYVRLLIIKKQILNQKLHILLKVCAPYELESVCFNTMLCGWFVLLE